MAYNLFIIKVTAISPIEEQINDICSIHHQCLRKILNKRWHTYLGVPSSILALFEHMINAQYLLLRPTVVLFLIQLEF